MKSLSAFSLSFVCSICLLCTTPSWAELSVPKGEVLLEVYGNIQVFNADDTAAFDRAMIDQLETHTIVTNNHVVSDVVPYKGPLLGKLLQQLGAQGKVARVYALDDYVAELSLDEIMKYKVILATEENGKALTINDKGPFFVVFPFNDYKELRDDSHYSQSVWQVKAIEIE